MSIRFTIGSGNSRHSFVRAPKHTAKWDEQKTGFRLSLGLPAHGKATNLSSSSAPRG
jgi:hypothetical protein